MYYRKSILNSVWISQNGFCVYIWPFQLWELFIEVSLGYNSKTSTSTSVKEGIMISIILLIVITVLITAIQNLWKIRSWNIYISHTQAHVSMYKNVYLYYYTSTGQIDYAFQCVPVDYTLRVYRCQEYWDSSALLTVLDSRVSPSKSRRWIRPASRDRRQVISLNVEIFQRRCVLT